MILILSEFHHSQWLWGFEGIVLLRPAGVHQSPPKIFHMVMVLLLLSDKNNNGCSLPSQWQWWLSTHLQLHWGLLLLSIEGLLWLIIVPLTTLRRIELEPHCSFSFVSCILLPLPHQHIILYSSLIIHIISAFISCQCQVSQIPHSRTSMKANTDSILGFRHHK